ncbi:flagella biosynthesis chaperone for FliD, FliT [Shewanella baltica]|uniref:flagella biosynthesis chaperone for FliD, FliT n=1 Tax=Shewanella baltica TaxID=62322 RepID=UPI00217D534C|nr:flagella biosynthesis chaperone for FliD, FliT [Shewanella baltica]MCS6191564.1 flagella biosynthesis chaperone for FliD, FliT [Shewanella baltica]
MHHSQINTQNVVSTLDSLNEQMNEIIRQVTTLSIDNENIDFLVLKLQEFVGQRQLLLEALVADEQFVDRDYLQLQFSLTQACTEKANIFLLDRQALLHAGSNSQRHINVYKSIDANR